MNIENLKVETKIQLRMLIVAILTLGLTLVFSILAYSRSWKSLNEAEKANLIASWANQIAVQWNEYQETSYNLQKMSILDERIKYSQQITAKTYDLMIEEWSIFNDVRIKIQNQETVKLNRNLERYIDQFQYIFHLYCNGFIRRKDITENLSWHLRFACENRQIEQRLGQEDDKKGFVFLCEDLYPWQTIMWKHKQEMECVSLDLMINNSSEAYKEVGIDILKE